MGRRGLRYADLPIRLKLLAPFIVLMVAWGGFGSYVLVRGSAGEARGRATAQLAEALDSARAAFSDVERSLLETVRAASRTQGVADAFVARDAERIKALVVPLLTNAGHPRMWAVDRAGRVLLRIDLTGKEPAVDAAGRLTAPAVLAAARGTQDRLGDKWSAVMGGSFVVAGPVRDARGLSHGAVAIAEDFSRIVGKIGRVTTARVAIFSRAGATLVSSEGGGALPFRATDDGRRASIEVGSEPYEVLYAPLEARDAAVATVAVAFPAGEALGQVARTARLLAFLVGAAVIIAVGIGLWTARAITRPLGSLLGATRALERGDLGARAPATSADEVGTLASSFNRMASELQASHEELERKVGERTVELERVNDELARASAAKSAFLATMSHELRTPLNAIIGFADMLSDPTFGRPDVRTTRDLSSNILTSGRHLLTLINDVLDLAKVEAGKIEIHPEPTHLGPVMGEVLAVVRPLGDQKRQRLSVRGAGDVPPVQADPARLRQILFNLVANAIKFTPDGGHVEVGVAPGVDLVTVSVSDTGPGLAPGEAAKIFEPFERGRASRNAEGAGLGLALARHLVELQGGRIWATGRPGRGSTFSFTIPVSRTRSRRPSDRPALTTMGG